MSDEEKLEKVVENTDYVQAKFDLVKHVAEYMYDHVMLLDENAADSILKAMQPIMLEFCEACGGAFCDSEYCPVGMYVKNIRDALNHTWKGWRTRQQQEEPKDV